ncbi:hypothetical protein NQ176_g1406 [Zarea fungicola]|uniref:Uncharacterized protein n=1 Tax=Zarea fungicola TaxID=93591 RepID=A0ACC1NU91_9HYPO|nr:hypothetical protein NQ176_g1406 [Lecanicillium fungicola]
MKPQFAAFSFIFHVALASPGARVVNRCPFAVYLQSVQQAPSETHELQPGDLYFEAYKPVIDGTGVSIKIATANLGTSLAGPLTQFEYAFVPGQNPDLYYDISSINDMAPRQFCQYGLHVQPSSAECASIDCPSDCGNFCSQVYNEPNDDFATKGCHASGDTTLTLCG